MRHDVANIWRERMALIKFIDIVHPRKTGNPFTGMVKLNNYVVNPEKTGNGLYTGSQNCILSRATEDMIATKRHFGKTSTSEHERYAYHFCISFRPDEKISRKMVLQIGKEFCEQYLPDYECVYGVHDDHDHLHCHISFNSINIVDGKKYRYEDGDWREIIQPLLDKICKSHGFHTLEEHTGLNLEEYELLQKEEKRGKYRRHVNKSDQNETQNKSTNKHRSHKYEKENETSWSAFIRNDVDQFVFQCKSFEEFLEKMKENGYEVKQGKYIAVKTKGMEKFRRLHTLGKNYSEAMINNRILAKNKKPVLPEIGEYVFVLPVQYYRFPRREYSEIRKQMIAKIYKLGLRPKRSRIDYATLRKSLKEAKQLDEKLNFITVHKIESSDMANSLIYAKELDLKNLEDDMKHLTQERNNYLPYIQIVKQMKDLEAAEECYRSGDINFREEYETYNQLLEKMRMTEIRFDDLLKFENKFKESKKEFRKQKRKIETDIKVLREIKFEYEELEKAKNNDLLESYDQVCSQYENQKRKKSR